MNRSSSLLTLSGISALLLGLVASSARSQDLAAPPSAACSAAPSTQPGAQKRWDIGSLLTVAMPLEKQGEANFHLKYATPASACLAETFQVAGASVAAGYTPWVKGASTLVYRFSVTRPDEKSEVLVLYDGLASYISGGPVFHVSQERKGVIAWYAMFSEEPALADLKPLVEQIVRGEAKPLMAVTWPKGAKESAVIAFDADRLK